MISGVGTAEDIGLSTNTLLARKRYGVRALRTRLCEIKENMKRRYGGTHRRSGTERDVSGSDPSGRPDTDPDETPTT